MILPNQESASLHNQMYIHRGQCEFDVFVIHDTIMNIKGINPYSSRQECFLWMEQ